MEGAGVGNLERIAVDRGPYSPIWPIAHPDPHR